MRKDAAYLQISRVTKIAESILDGEGKIIEKLLCLFTYMPLRLLRGILYQLVQDRARKMKISVARYLGFLLCRVKINSFPLFFLLPDGNKAIIKFGDLATFIALIDVYDNDVYQRYYKTAKDDVVFDIGAHIGYFSLMAAKRVNNRGLIVAVEPDPYNLRTLTRNVQLNHKNNIVVVNAALSNFDGESVLYADEYFSAGSSLYSGAGKRVKITVYKLDTLVNKMRITRIDMVKIDAEGAEVNIIKGAIMCLKMQIIRNLAIAAYHVSKHARIFIVEQLQRHGYGALLTAEGYIYASLNMPSILVNR